jgi:hypothetical protein
MDYALHVELPILWQTFVQCLPFYLVVMAFVGAGLGLALWQDSRIIIRRYAFRADLIIQRGCPTIYQGCHVIIPARNLEQAEEVAGRMGNLNETCLSYDPEFRHG